MLSVVTVFVSLLCVFADSQLTGDVRWLFSSTAFYTTLWDSTRGIDVGAKLDVYNVINDLAAKGKSILFISSELPEILGMCDRIYVMNKGRIVGEFARDEASQEDMLNLMI